MSDSYQKRERTDCIAPSPVKKSKQSSGRDYTISMCVPDSILYTVQSQELRAYLVSQISRAAAIFCIDEIVVYKDPQASQNAQTQEEAVGFFARNLEYLETPQYLRKALFPMHPDLRCSGLLNPLDTPHHLRSDETFQYREGVVVEIHKNRRSSWVDIGLRRDALVNQSIQPGTRITVKIQSYDPMSNNNVDLEGSVVSPSEPREQLGVYWGYTTRIANNLDGVFNDCPFEEGYDLTIGTSDQGDSIDSVKQLPRFKHAIIMFGGLAGIEDILEAEETVADKDPRSIFNLYLNTCPYQGTRTIRTEEAIMISLGSLLPKISSGRSTQ